MHQIAEIDGVEKLLPPPKKPEESVKELLKRAEAAAEARLPDSEPLPGTSVPDGWPRFNVGDEVGPVKGWWMRVESVDVVQQTLTLKPSRKAGREKQKPGPKRRRSRRRR